MIQMAGVLNLRAPPTAVDPSIIARMCALLHAPSHTVYPPVSLGALSMCAAELCTVPENLGIQQPVRPDWTRSAILFDGRADNREELAEYCGWRRPLSGTGDPELVLACFEFGGIESIKRIVGPFAFALWDNQVQQLVCARDCFGMGQLYYAVTTEHFVFSSQLPALLGCSSVRRELDSEYLADYLANGYCFSTRTPLTGVRSLAPSHVLVVRNADVQIRRYYDLPEDAPVKFNRDEDYEEAFRNLFRTSVGRCLRASRAISADLSGGHDSSSIVSAAAKFYPELTLNSRSFRTMTIYSDQSADADERVWVNHVLAHYPMPNVRVNADDYPHFEDILEAAAFSSVPNGNIPIYPLLRAVQQSLETHDIGIVLSGIGAEPALIREWPNPLHLADYLRKRQWRALLTESARWQRELQKPWLYFIRDNWIRPLIRHTESEPAASWKCVPDWIDSDFAKRTEFIARAHRPVSHRRFPTAASQFHYELIARAHVMFNRGYTGLCFEQRFPFLYRPLVEFMFTAPWDQKVRPGQHKSLLRRALTDILPDEIRLRRTKGGGTDYAYRALNSNWHEIQPLLNDSVLASLGCLKPAAWRKEWNLARTGYSKQFLRLVATLNLEAWLRVHLRGETPPMKRTKAVLCA
jgi:asparagine synthase (glutamine-hydrolysing)